MSNIANKIKPKILKVINKFSTNVTIYRAYPNAFGEEEEKIKICDVVGFYHESNATSSIKAVKNDSGETVARKQAFLMVLYDDETIKIQENDFIFLDDKKYYIKDKGNQNRLNIYFDMLLGE